MQTIQLEVDARGVARIMLARPDVHNALNLQMIREFSGALGELSAGPGLRALVITGAGESFCAGGDLDWMREMRSQQRETRIGEAGELAGLLNSLNAFPAPVIARVNGHAFGGGVGILCCCDVAIAVDTARFGLTEVRLGLIPATISPFVVRRIGVNASRRWMLSGRRFPPSAAQEVGLLQQVVSAGELDAAVEKEVEAYLSCAPGAVAAAKRLIATVSELGLGEACAQTPDLLADTWETPEAAEGIDAFFDRRRPSWRDS